MTMTLYTLCGADSTRHFSPHVWKVVMALNHKGLAFETRPTRFTEIPTVENGATRTVPLLRDGDRLVVDSFAIAEYLDEAYPDRPSLFGGEGGRAACRFIEAWTQTQIQAAITRIVVKDIYSMLDETDQAYFKPSREARLGTTLDEVHATRSQWIETLQTRLEPLRSMLARQPYLGGETPLFADYIVFGALQWMRITARIPVLKPEDPVSLWFERCLDLYEGAGRKVPAGC